MKTKLTHLLLAFALCASFAPAAFAQPKKPNIVIIWGDDIGQCDVIDRLLTVPAVASLDES